MSGTSERTERPEYVREVSREQCIGCGAISETVEGIDHEVYCPEVTDGDHR